MSDAKQCPDWHSRPQAGCHVREITLGDGYYESYEWHCPGCCPEGLGESDDDDEPGGGP